MRDDLMTRQARGRASERSPGSVHAAHNQSRALGAGFVYVVDDDALIRVAVVELLQSVGFNVRGYASASEMLNTDLLDTTTNCIIIDVRMPGISGLELQARLRGWGIRAPIVFMTGHADVPMTVQAMKAGAFDFLAKPFRDQELLDAVSKAVSLNSERIESETKSNATLARFETLSAREREVMMLVTAGLMNKQAAAKIDIAVSTVKSHRTQIMKKMKAKSLAELVRMAEQLGQAAAK
jgi:FixJ family two-component response regulator